jgi:hypothetical protein
MNTQLVELENGRVQIRTLSGRIADIQERDDSWIFEKELPEKTFPTLGDAFDFISQIEATIGTVRLLNAVNDPDSIPVRYADVEYFGAVYKDARYMNEKWHVERLSGQVSPFKFQGRVKLLNQPMTKRRCSLDPTCAFSADAR